MSRPEEQVGLKFFYGTHSNYSALPAWWFEKHRDNPDIFLQNSRGESHIRGYHAVHRYARQQFNYWNQEVREAQNATLEGAGKLMVHHGVEDRVLYLDMAQEAQHFIVAGGRSSETGYNREAVAAFQERLEAKYRDITALNGKWGSSYAGFDRIQPPEDWRLKPELKPGLRYEFNRFRHDSWHGWMQDSIEAVRRGLGRNVPAVCDPSVIGANVTDGLDLVKLFETFDVVAEHRVCGALERPGHMRRYANLKEAFNSSTGNGEWMPRGFGDLFGEETLRDSALRRFYQLVQWGQSYVSFWLGHDFGYMHNANWTDNRLGHTVLRYHSSYIPLGIARAKAHREIYLEKPLAAADVGILESGTSFYNVQNTRAGVFEFYNLLDSRGHNYGFLFERLMTEGRQSLDGYRVVIMPNASCLPERFTDKLLSWVDSGGVLLTTGAPGVMNEYGIARGVFPDRVLGAGAWTYERGVLRLKNGAGGIEVIAADSAGRPALIGKSYGEGRVYMRLGAAVSEEQVYGVISRHAPRLFYCANNSLHMVMRRGEAGTLYLSLMNPDLNETVEEKIVLAGTYPNIADISNNFPIIPETSAGKTSFSVRLVPADGVMIRIQR